jgi:hypothetical protein
MPSFGQAPDPADPGLTCFRFQIPFREKPEGAPEEKPAFTETVEL